MDNAFFHHPESIEQMCSQAGVKLVYLPPYSPDLNPIEELFSNQRLLLNGAGKPMKTIPTRDLIPF
jgi:transposase